MFILDGEKKQRNVSSKKNGRSAIVCRHSHNKLRNAIMTAMTNKCHRVV